MRLFVIFLRSYFPQTRITRPHCLQMYYSFSLLCWNALAEQETDSPVSDSSEVWELKIQWIRNCDPSNESRLIQTVRSLQIPSSSIGYYLRFVWLKMDSHFKLLLGLCVDLKKVTTRILWDSFGPVPPICFPVQLVDIGEDPVGDTSTVGVPRQSVFGPTLSLITSLPVNQQDGEIYDIEVRQKMWES